MTISPFHGDRPIQSIEEDRFGFEPLAARIAEALTTQAAGKGFVMGLEGRWGSGKSSLLGRVVANLKSMDTRKVAVVEFRPWLIGDRDQLLVGLFADLVKAIAGLEYAGGDATRSTTIRAKDVAKKAQQFASHLGPVGKLAGLVGMVVSGAGLVGTFLEGLSICSRSSASDAEPTS